MFPYCFHDYFLLLQDNYKVELTIKINKIFSSISITVGIFLLALPQSSCISEVKGRGQRGKSIPWHLGEEILFEVKERDSNL